MYATSQSPDDIRSRYNGYTVVVTVRRPSSPFLVRLLLPPPLTPLVHVVVPPAHFQVTCVTRARLFNEIVIQSIT